MYGAEYREVDVRKGPVFMGKGAGGAYEEIEGDAFFFH